MKKILHITNYYYPHVGGIETTTRDIANVLKSQKGIEQKIICFGDGPNIVDDIEIIRVPYYFKFASQAISFRYYYVLKDTINSFNPDLILIHTPNPLIEHYLLKCHYKGVIIVYHHLDVFRQKFLKYFVHPTQKHLNKRADLILSHSKQYIDNSEELKNFTDKCRILPLCFKEKDFKFNSSDIEQAKWMKEKFKNKTIVFYSGRHTKTKALNLGIKACRDLDDVIFLIGRVGNKKRSFESLIKRSKNVVYLGQILDHKLYALYLSLCDIFLFPSISKNDAFPITLIEAISLGKPCVTFNVKGSGISYISPNNETGITCENGNYLALRDAINILKSNKELKMKLSKNGIERAKTLFTYERFANDVKTIFTEYLNKKKG